MKLKRYVIMIDRVFPAHLSRKGETNFHNKILMGAKIHVIKKNYELWEKRILAIQLGKAVLELRQWAGRPYHSKQVHLLTLSSADGVGIQRYAFVPEKNALPSGVTPEGIAKNDGVSFKIFQEWFREVKCEDELAIIHFTSFRY